MDAGKRDNEAILLELRGVVRWLMHLVRSLDSEQLS